MPFKSFCELVSSSSAANLGSQAKTKLCITLEIKSACLVYIFSLELRCTAPVQLGRKQVRKILYNNIKLPGLPKAIIIPTAVFTFGSCW